MSRFVVLLLLSAVAGCDRSAARHTSQPPPDLDYPVGAFALTERSGKTVTADDLKGKVWVASFVFTRCPGPCKSVTATVARLQAELPAAPDLRLVTFTVDPARDDPDELTKYAAIYKADPNRWLFLTGDEKTVHDLLQTRFKQSVGAKPAAGMKPGDEFANHSTRLAVVDRKGVIRGFYEGLPDDQFPDGAERFADSQRRLKEKVDELLRER